MNEPKVDHPFTSRARYMMPSGHEVRFSGASLDLGQPVANFEYVLPKANRRRTALGESVTLAQKAWHLPVKLAA